MWREGQVVLCFNVDGGAGGTGLSCGLWREDQVALGFHVEERQVALGFHVEGRTGGTRLLYGGRGRWH